MRVSVVLAVVSATALFLSPVARGQSDPAKATIDLMVPDAIKPTGAHGTVILEGDITPEKRIANLLVTKSSRSEEIDQFVLNRYAHAPIRDLPDGASRIQLTVQVYNTRGPLDTGARYSCQQAVLDNDWYKRTFETTDDEQTQIYKMMRLTRFMRSLDTTPDSAQAVLAADKRFKRIWSDALEACRATPEANWLDTFTKQVQ